MASKPRRVSDAGFEGGSFADHCGEVAQSSLQYLLLAVVQEYDGLRVEFGWTMEQCLARLQSIGVHMGVRVIETMTAKVTRFAKEIDIIKFMCKEFWQHCFHKAQVDKLQTNHKGTYVFHDFSHPWISRISAEMAADSFQPPSVGSVEYNTSRFYLTIVAGMIEGALCNLGRQCTVSLQIPVGLPKCQFSIEMERVSKKSTAMEGERPS